MEPLTGIEPVTSSLPRRCSTAELQGPKWSGKRDSNPRPSAWKADALPTELFPRWVWAGAALVQDGREGQCLRRRNGGGRWIRTTVGVEPTGLQPVPFGRSGIPPELLPARLATRFEGLCPPLRWRWVAGGGNRTRNLLLTKQLLCRLSHASRLSSGRRERLPRRAADYSAPVRGVKASASRSAERTRGSARHHLEGLHADGLALPVHPLDDEGVRIDDAGSRGLPA